MAKANVSQGTARDSYNELAKKIAQLEALLFLTYGESFDSFHNMNKALCDNYMWVCADLAQDCGTLLAAIPFPAEEVAHV